MKRIIGIGAGGSTKVILDILREYDDIEIIGLVDDDPMKQGKIFQGLSINGDSKSLCNLRQHFDEVIICVGSTRDTAARSKLFKFLKQSHFNIASAVSVDSHISSSAILREGSIVMPGVMINAGTEIGNNVFINTGTIIEHDCHIGDSCFLGPGCVVSGAVYIGNNTFVGSGTIIIGYMKIGNNVTLGAGSVVVRDIPDNVVAFGNPAHRNRKEKRIVL